MSEAHLETALGPGDVLTGSGDGKGLQGFREGEQGAGFDQDQLSRLSSGGMSRFTAASIAGAVRRQPDTLDQASGVGGMGQFWDQPQRRGLHCDSVPEFIAANS